MTAVIRPVCIKDSHLGNSGIPVLVIKEIVADMKEILKCHRKSERIVELLQIILGHGGESVEGLDIFGLGIIDYKSIGLLGSGFP